MITMLRSVEGQASYTDKRYLFNSVQSLDPAKRDNQNDYITTSLQARRITCCLVCKCQRM